MDHALDLASLRRRYLEGTLTPTRLMDALLPRLLAEDTHRVWITRLAPERIMAFAQALEGRDPQSLPLYGIPFAIKDNIDLAGVPTTCACPQFAYTPATSAAVVERLIAAGAIPLGKTNLDQFATGLNGTRSPYGASRNPFNRDYIAGGSSSGSALAVALGLASFALGTDTAGSGRVPAAFTNLIGHKPTCGTLSTRGVVPACRSLDQVSIFALTAEDAETVMAVAAGYDAQDPFSRPLAPHDFDFGSGPFRFALPREDQLEFFGDEEAARRFDHAVASLEALGGEAVRVDISPFLAAAELLYGGPWVAERYAAIREFFDRNPEAVIEPVRTIIAGGRTCTAAEAFLARYRLADLKRRSEETWARADVLVLPTTPTIYRVEEILKDPVQRNARLGYYTNFVNLLDLAATAVPAGFRADGLPFGITLIARPHQDGPLLHLAARVQRRLSTRLGATAFPLPAPAPGLTLKSGMMQLAVFGAHLSGLPLNDQLIALRARLIGATRTATRYRLYALPDGKRPGLARVENGGAAIACEVWELPEQAVGAFLAGIAPPLGLGHVELADGSRVAGFICESGGLTGARDITAYGGWRAFLADQRH